MQNGAGNRLGYKDKKKGKKSLKGEKEKGKKNRSTSPRVGSGRPL